MQSLREAIAKAEEGGYALGHFNFSNLETLHGIVQAAKDLNLPVLVGLSEGERDFVGVKEARALVDSLKTELEIPIYLGADHTYTIERVKEVIDAGFDIVVVDGSALSYEENVKLTKEAVAYAKASGKEVLVEGELGYIGTSSKILEELPEDVKVEGDDLTSAEEAEKFVRETGVDLFAPAVGNIHGTLKHQADPRLDLARIKEIRQSAGVPLVLHGGSGTSEEDLKGAIKAGISIIHINTELRVAYKQAVKMSLQEYPEEIAPYKIMKGTVSAIHEMVKKRLELFSCIK